MRRIFLFLWLAFSVCVSAQSGGPAGFLPRAAVASGGPTRSLLLDVISTNKSGAFATWKLTTNYTGPLVRIRDSVGNNETDFYEGATPSTLNTTSGGGGTDALTKYGSGTNGFVVRWYDQNGNSHDMVQTTAANQPMIIKNGAYVFTQNGYPCISFTNAVMTVTNGNAYAAPAQYHIMCAAKPTAAVSYMGLFHPDNPSTGWAFLEHGTQAKMNIERANSAKQEGTALTSGTAYLLDANYDGSNDHNFKNGSADDNAAGDSGYGSAAAALGSGYASSTAQGWNGWIACVVIWSKALSSSDATTARNNINTGDGVSSGLAIY